jgi:hypothetical protein
MNWKGRERNRSWPNLRCYPDIFLEGLRKLTRTTARIIDDPADSKRKPSEYKSETLGRVEEHS